MMDSSTFSTFPFVWLVPMGSRSGGGGQGRAARCEGTIQIGGKGDEDSEDLNGAPGEGVSERNIAHRICVCKNHLCCKNGWKSDALEKI